MTSIPVPLLVLPWLLAVAAWLAFPWLARTVGRPDLLRWLPPVFVVFGGALLWLSTGGGPADGHAARSVTIRTAAAGLCQAAEALPDDRDRSIRAFTNRAHGPLHELAADPELPRAEVAELLRAKERVEALIAEDASGAAIVEPLDALRAALEAAVVPIGVDVDPCAS